MEPKKIAKQSSPASVKRIVNICMFLNGTDPCAANVVPDFAIIYQPFAYQCIAWKSDILQRFTPYQNDKPVIILRLVVQEGKGMIENRMRE